MIAVRFRTVYYPVIGPFQIRCTFARLSAAGTGIALVALPAAYPVWRYHPILIPVGVLIAFSLISLSGVVSGEVRKLLRRTLMLLPWLLAGYAYAHWQVGAALADRVPRCADADIRSFRLEVLDAPTTYTLGEGGGEPLVLARFEALASLTSTEGCEDAGSYRVRISWYAPPEIDVGDIWQVEGRLRPPWGNLNPGGFDYERWMLGQGLNGSGYVRHGVRITSGGAGIDYRTRLRSRLSEWLAEQHLAREGIVLALMTGDDSALSRSEWQLLRDSGTIHLMVVSGLHVGMVSAIVFLAARILVRFSETLLLAVGARRSSALMALAGSGGYVWLSGAGVPALRAWLMSAMLLFALSAGRVVRGSRVVILVMVLMLVVDPLVVQLQGFWLSFAAVFALVSYYEPARSSGERRAAGRRLLRGIILFAQAQIVLLLALSPLLAEFQGGIPLQSPLVNGLVVPMITFVVLPLVLLMAAFAIPLPWLAGHLAQWIDGFLSLVMECVEIGATFPAVPSGLDGLGEWGAMALVLLCLSGRHGWGAGFVFIACWWTLLHPDGQQPSPGRVRVTALDVGQGTAILVDTHDHRLIYDTGAAYPSGFNLGDAVVVPSFRRTGLLTLDGLILSHDDLDHTGGAEAVVERLAPEKIWASFPISGERAGFSGRQVSRCAKGEHWRWDEVTFRFLHPPERWQGSDNDGSCVLLISTGEHSVLIGGDISARVERMLPTQKVDLLFAPHHGSRTSSSRGLIRRLRPDIVFISTDRRSRYGHPHPDVIARYRDSRIYVTGRQGALIWDSGDPETVEKWRDDRGAYWHHWP